MVPATLEAVDILGLMKLLPHRYPFLMIDRIVEIDGNDSAIGIKNVTINEPHFQGHFPDQPVMPGVGSVNQIDSSDLTTTSFGEFNRLFSKCVAIAVIVPSCSVRVT